MPLEITDVTEDSSVTTTPESDSETPDVESDVQLDEDGGVTDVTTTDDTDETDTFNPRQYEESLGFPAGSLKDCKTEDEALAEIRKLTDQALNAGFGLSDKSDDATGVDDADASAPDSNSPTQAPKPTTIESLTAMVTSLQKRLDEREANELKARKSSEQRARQLIDQRLDSEIDSWGSAKFGVKGSRTYDQTRELARFKETTLDFIAGLQASNRPIPTIEKVARSCLAYVDAEAFVSHVKGKKGKKTDQTPLGTPGSSSSASRKDAPKNIHEAVFRDGRYVSSSSLK